MSLTIDWSYVAYVTERHKQEAARILEPPALLHIGGNGTVQLCPRLLIWDPPSQHSITLRCPHHGIDLHPRGWWTSARKRPRKLFDAHGPVYLVAREYECPGDHIPGTEHLILSTDEQLLTTTSESIPVPFVLTHRAGFTADLRHTITQR
jgi:hypothetical protein